MKETCCASGLALCNGLLAAGHDLAASLALRQILLVIILVILLLISVLLIILILLLVSATTACFLQLRTLQVAAQCSDPLSQLYQFSSAMR